MELNNIPKTGSYGTGVDLHNDNYSKIGLKLETLENMSFNEKGYFETLSALQTKYPTPQSGWQAYVKDAGSSTGYYIADVQAGSWVITSAEAPPISVDLDGYVKEEDLEDYAKVEDLSEYARQDDLAQLARSVTGDVFYYKGFIRRSDGVFVLENAYKATPFLKLSSMSLVLNNVFGTATVTICAFYDKDFIFIESDSTVQAGVSKTINPDGFPNGAVYVRCTAASTQASASVVGVMEFNLDRIMDMMLALNFNLSGTPVYQYDCVKSSEIVWANKDKGVITFDDYNENEACFTSFQATNTYCGMRIVQPPVIFAPSGEIADYPQLTIETY